MKNNSQVYHNKLKKVQVSTAYDPTCKVISYTQYSMFLKCPKQWELAYIKKLKPKDSSIHLVYGTAIHSVVQEWLTIAFTKSVKASDEYDMASALRTNIAEEYKKAKEAFGEHFSTPAQLAEFYQDGITTLEWLRKKRRVYFSSKGVELAGIEIPLSLNPVSSHPKVKLTAFIDVVLFDKRDGVFTIYDVKTSTRGWSADDKVDKTKTDQVLLYKKYFSKLYNVEEDKIKVEFIILRRKIDEDSLYPPKRVQTVVPAQKSVSIGKFTKQFEKWITDCFTPEGEYNTDRIYPAVSGKNKSNCRFCPFSTNYELCPIEKRAQGTLVK